MDSHSCDGGYVLNDIQLISDESSAELVLYLNKHTFLNVK